jgi:hypothetical protein
MVRSEKKKRKEEEKAVVSGPQMKKARLKGKGLLTHQSKKAERQRSLNSQHQRRIEGSFPSTHERRRKPDPKLNTYPVRRGARSPPPLLPFNAPLPF